MEIHIPHKIPIPSCIYDTKFDRFVKIHITEITRSHSNIDCWLSDSEGAINLGAINLSLTNDIWEAPAW